MAKPRMGKRNREKIEAARMEATSVFPRFVAASGILGIEPSLFYDPKDGSEQDDRRRQPPGQQMRHVGDKLSGQLEQVIGIDRPERPRAQKHAPPMGHECHGECPCDLGATW